MNWFFLPIIATLLWASTNFIDKHLVSKYFKGRQGALIIYSCLIGLPAFILIGIFYPRAFNIAPLTALLIILNSFLYILYLFPYLAALKKADTSVVSPMFETIPVFTYFLALIFLKEVLTLKQMLASVLIIVGAIGISVKLKKKTFHIRKDVVWLMLLASFLVSLNWLFFKVFAIDLDFWTTSFWQYIGFFIFGVITFTSSRSYRKDFLNSFKKSRGKIISLNAMNEIINLSAVIIFSYATLLAPLALVSVLNGIQPFFSLIIGILLSVFFPHWIKEEISKKIILQKIIFILIILLGLYLIGTNL